MEIKDLQPNKNFEFLKVRIIAKNGPRLVGKYRKKSYVTDVLVVDKSGNSCSITVWGKEEADKYRVNKIIEIHNGWCKEYMGIKQISTGREGYVTVLDRDDPSFPRSIKE